MVLCLVADATNYHIRKWVLWFSHRGHNVHVISFVYAEIDGVKVHSLLKKIYTKETDLKKLAYLKCFKECERIIAEIKPDVISVHFASSYGSMIGLSNIKGYALSVWGADVYDFPRKSPLHRLLIRFSLSRAGKLLSTSNAMIQECAKYTHKPFETTPFGVDMELFSPKKRCVLQHHNHFVIGTIKSLKPKYGIEYLIRATALIMKKRPDIPLQLRIGGTGEDEEYYHSLAESLGLKDTVKWLGFIQQDQVAIEWANMDVAIIPSVLDSESFGVSAVEAEACAVPVIISDIPGLMESTNPGITSIVINRADSTAIAEKVIWMFDHPEERIEMGKKGREFVEKRFELNHCFEKIESIFLDMQRMDRRK